MRVVGGTARGRRLLAPRGVATRPTSDRVREAVFSILDSMGGVSDSIVVDLFAGSGALGIEALSRGAQVATFVERNRAVAALIRSNLEALGDEFVDRGSVVVGDAVSFVGRMSPCDVMFADPPYAFADWAGLLGGVGSAAGLLVAETGAPLEPVEGWQTVKAKTYGGTVVTVARPMQAGKTSRPGEI